MVSLSAVFAGWTSFDCFTLCLLTIEVGNQMIDEIPINERRNISMQKYLIFTALVSVLANGQAIAACQYTLDATVADAAQYSTRVTNSPNLIELFPTLVGQKAITQLKEGYPFKQNVIGSDIGLQSIVAAYDPATITFPKIGDISLGSGIFAGEVEILTPPTSLSGNGSFGIGYTLYGSRTGDPVNKPDSLRVDLGVRKVANAGVNQFHVVVSVLNMLDHTSVTKQYPLLVNRGTNRIGFYLNNSSGQLGVIVNSANKGYIASILPANIDKVSFVGSANSELDDSDSNIGSNVSIQLKTDPSTFSYTYPSGAKDICGNTI